MLNLGAHFVAYVHLERVFHVASKYSCALLRVGRVDEAEKLVGKELKAPSQTLASSSSCQFGAAALKSCEHGDHAPTVWCWRWLVCLWSVMMEEEVHHREA
ncbi:hypothetical protein GRJ2_002264600 [Grus japonensis]|uniref:Uncharacterized protein n=1 Tax=Grus japonensis TaxID=30415 RepID=A0ABC9XLQ5_GRUJA